MRAVGKTCFHICCLKSFLLCVPFSLFAFIVIVYRYYFLKSVQFLSLLFNILSSCVHKNKGKDRNQLASPHHGTRKSKEYRCIFFCRLTRLNLRIKIQRWFFYMMCANAFSLGISKKIGKIFFGFWLLSFFLKKIGYSHSFAGGAWKRRRTTCADFEYEIWKVFDTPIHGKSLRCLRW